MNTARRNILLIAAVAALLLPACGNSAGNTTATTAAAEDSAGVRIIDNQVALWKPGEEWKVSAEPTLDIGVDVGAPEYEFGYAHGPVRLSDGRIVVADMQSNEMRFYDPRGKFLMKAGGSGKGPGEFEQLYRLRKIAGDSLMALNPASLTSIFSPTGQYVRRFDLARVPGRSNLWWLGRLSDGTLLAMSLQRQGTRELAPPADARPGEEHPAFDVPERPDTYRDTLMHFLFTMEGRLIDSITRLPGQWLGRTRALVPNAAYAFFDNTFHHSPGDVVEIRSFRSLAAESGSIAGRRKGRLVRIERIIRRRPLRDPATTDDDRNQYFAGLREQFRQWAARNPGAANAAFLERELASTTFPATVPAHGNRMYADALGNLWLQEYRIGPDEPFRWSVFDTVGRWLGIVETPAQFTVNEIGADYVLGVWDDDLDVQHVRMYRLDKP